MTNDAVTVAPHMHKVILENDRVRILEVVVTPGVSAEMHSHPDHIMVILQGGTMQMTTKGKDPEKVELTPGQSIYRNALEHSAINVGDTEVKFILIELK